MEYNIYCDESCHLQNDQNSVMVLGALWCLKEKRSEISQRLKEIKIKHGLSAQFEVKELTETDFNNTFAGAIQLFARTINIETGITINTLLL